MRIWGWMTGYGRIDKRLGIRGWVGCGIRDKPLDGWMILHLDGKIAKGILSNDMGVHMLLKLLLVDNRKLLQLLMVDNRARGLLQVDRRGWPGLQVDRRGWPGLQVDKRGWPGLQVDRRGWPGLQVDRRG